MGPKTESEIVNLIFKDYSEKMWDIPWEQLPHTIKNRVPKIRDSYDSCYHDDLYRGLPINGYTEIVNAMLEGTTVHLNADKNIWRKYNSDLLVYTGKLDAYFHNFKGRLGYRSLSIALEPGARQECFQINECNKNKSYTRTVDYSFLNGETLNNGLTMLAREYPCEHNGVNTAFYPKNFKEDRVKYEQYADLARQQKNVLFLGRLATYKYLDMDAAIGQALSRTEKING